MNNTNILLRHNLVSFPSSSDDKLVDQSSLVTIMMNLSYYGKALNKDAYKHLSSLSRDSAISWWKAFENEIKVISGESRKIGDFVVYKNFPEEVLSKSDAEYWSAQILMYWGFPAEYFTEQVQPRAKMSEQPVLTVLKKANSSSLKDIFTSYLKSPARWKKEELEDVMYLSDQLPTNFSKLSFKENLITLATYFIDNDKAVKISSGTDVLRLASGLSGGDVSLRTNSKFISFKKPVRRFLLGIMKNCSNLDEDMARRPELWKRLIHQLHPGDYKNKFPNVVRLSDSLYNNKLVTFNSQVERFLGNKSAKKTLELLSSRPGEFRRRLIHTIDLFGNNAVVAFTKPEVLNSLTNNQIVSLKTFLQIVNVREHRVFPPKGNWSQLKVGEPRPIDEKHIKKIVKSLNKVLEERLPKVNLDESMKMVKLPNNSEVSLYNRGTVFPIPKNVKFIRTASYWKNNPQHGVVWFDNGWNFFDQSWKDLGSCCWLETSFPKSAYYGKNNKDKAAVFSGDPINCTEMQGRAAQLIDLYPEKLKAAGVSYAVWNILCYSKVPFSKADDVFASLQWGENPIKGNLFEPSRSQLAFPLTGEQYTKYIALLDLNKMEMVYLDANLKSNISASSYNGKVLSEQMPAFMEYLKSLPSVYDLFEASKDVESKIPMIYSDKETSIKSGTAYVFKPENKDNKFKTMNINELL